MIESIELFYITVLLLPNSICPLPLSLSFLICVQQQGYFFTVCFEAVVRLAAFAHANDRVFCINLSATYLTELYKKELVQIMPYVDILFGNEQVRGALRFTPFSYYA